MNTRKIINIIFLALISLLLPYGCSSGDCERMFNNTQNPIPPVRQKQAIAVKVIYYDGVPITGVLMQIPGMEKLTDANGMINFEYYAENGTEIDFLFSKTNHVIEQGKIIIGQNTTLLPDGTHLYKLEVKGYIPLTAAGITGRPSSLTELAGLMYQPEDMEVSKDGNTIYISDKNPKAIRKITIDPSNPDAKNISTIITTPEQCDGIAVTGDEKYMYIVSGKNIYKYAIPDGKTGKAEPLLIATFTDKPFDLTLSDDDSSLYVSFKILISDPNAIIKLNANTGERDLSFIPNVSFSQPSAMAYAKNSNMLYVADSINGRILRLNAATGQNDTTFNAPYDEPLALKLSKDETTLYVSYKDTTSFSGLNSLIGKINTVTNAKTAIINLGQDSFKPNQPPNSFLGAASHIYSLGLSPDEKTLYACDNWDGTVMKINIAAIPSNDASIFAGWSTSYVDAPVRIPLFNEPEGIALSPDEKTLYVADPKNSQIKKVNPATGEVSTFVSSLDYPTGLAMSDDGTMLYYAETNLGIVKRINVSTAQIDTSFEVSGLLAPTGMTLSKTDGGKYLYVSETGTFFDTNALITRIDTAAGSVDPSFSFAASSTGLSGIAISSDDKYLYVSDSNSASILKIDTATGLDEPSFIVSGLSVPTGLTISSDDSCIFVLDIDMSGEFKTTIKQISAQNGSIISILQIQYWPEIANLEFFESPTIGLGLAITKNSSRIYLANQNTEVIQMILASEP